MSQRGIMKYTLVMPLISLEALMLISVRAAAVYTPFNNIQGFSFSCLLTNTYFLFALIVAMHKSGADLQQF